MNSLLLYTVYRSGLNFFFFFFFIKKQMEIDGYSQNNNNFFFQQIFCKCYNFCALFWKLIFKTIFTNLTNQHTTFLWGHILELFANLVCKCGNLHSKKRVTIFPSPPEMSLTKLSLTGQGEFCQRHPGWGRKKQ